MSGNDRIGTDTSNLKKIRIFHALLIYLSRYNPSANPGLQGAMRGPGLVMIITRRRHCLWNLMTEYRNYDTDLTLSWTDSGVQISLYHGQHSFRWWSFPVRYKAITWADVLRVVPFDTLGTGSSVNVVYGTWTSGELFRTISIRINIQHFQWIKSISKWRMQNGRHIFQASIW